MYKFPQKKFEILFFNFSTCLSRLLELVEDRGMLIQVDFEVDALN